MCSFIFISMQMTIVQTIRLSHELCFLIELLQIESYHLWLISPQFILLPGTLVIFSNCKFECGKNNSVSSHDKILKRQNYGDEIVSYFFLVFHEFLKQKFLYH